MLGNIGGAGSNSNRSRIFVPHFPKRVTDDNEDMDKRNMNDLNIQPNNYNLQQLIQNTDKNYEIAYQNQEQHEAPSSGRIYIGDGSHGFHPKDAHTAIWDQSFMSQEMLHVDKIGEEELDESTMVIDSGIPKT